MELVAPIFSFQQPNTWHAHIDSIWWVLTNKFNTWSTEQCSTHVHASPSEGQWTLSQIRNVAKAALYFERSIDSVLPPSRRANIWCQSNRWNATFKSYEMPTLFSWIEQAGNIPHVAFLMCTFSKDSEYGKAMGHTQNIMFNAFRWNFTPLQEGSKETIEFRQPPGSGSANET